MKTKFQFRSRLYLGSSIDEKNLRHHSALIMSSLNEIESLKKKVGA